MGLHQLIRLRLLNCQSKSDYLCIQLLSDLKLLIFPMKMDWVFFKILTNVLQS